MEMNNIRPVDRERAARLTMAVLSDDDAMAALVFNDMNADEREDVVILTMLAQASHLVGLLKQVFGLEVTVGLLQSTLAQHFADESS